MNSNRQFSNTRNGNSYRNDRNDRNGGGGSGGGKKYCSVCHKKGLSESVYTSHYTKTQPGDKGIVVCPTILAAKCNYCGENGHWANINYCAAMKYDEKIRAKSHNKTPPKPPSPTSTRPVSNVYGVLNADSDDEDDARPQNVSREVPKVVSKVVPAPLPKPGVAWAQMAKKAPVVSIPAPAPSNMVSLKPKVSASAEGDDPTKVSEPGESAATPAKMPLGVIATSRWAVAESSDEGEDEDEGEYYEDPDYYSEEMENNYPDTASDEPDDPWKYFK